jgi:hypothetical protein
MECATSGNVKCLRRVLDDAYSGDAAELDSSARAIRTAQVRTAAQRAASFGQVHTLRLLLERGAAGTIIKIARHVIDRHLHPYCLSQIASCDVAGNI